MARSVTRRSHPRRVRTRSRSAMPKPPRACSSAGFDGLGFEDVCEPVFYGRGIDDALETVRGFQRTSAALATLSGDEPDRAVERLREVLAAHHRAEHGVVFDSRSWLITARRSHRH